MAGAAVFLLVARSAIIAGALSLPSGAKVSFVQAAERASTEGMGQNPISKVTSMLEDLQSEMIDDRNIEQGLFDKYTCWYDTVMGSKKQSISEATDRVEALTSYIDDIESGRIEFSSEGAEATKDVQELNEEIEKMDQRREKEHDDYKAAKEEMETAIGGLESALETMEDGTEGSLLTISQSAGLKQVADLATAVLPSKDAAFLAEVVKSGKLNKPDYDKLNKKNVHGQKYEMRSGKIQELISDMLKTFKDNLDEANSKEDETKSTHEKLRGTKDDQLQSAEDALSAMGGETASRDEAKAEAQGEVGTLEDQVTDDKKIVTDTTSDYERNRDLWKERKKLMTLEISAVSKAISILKSDEARDAMSTAFDDKKVFNPAATAGANFLQIGSRKNGTAAKKNSSVVFATAKANGTAVAASSKKKKVALHAAATALKGAVKAISKSAVAAAHHKKIQKLVDMLRAKAREGGDFDVVHKILNKQKKDIKAEATEDKEKKEECETLLVEKTESAQSSSNFIDGKSRFINRTEFEVADLWDVVNKTVGEVEELEWELNDATVERADFHNAFLKEKAGLEAAIGFIEQAKKALDKFYEDNSLGAHALVQTNTRLQKPKKAAALVRLRVATKKAANPDMIVEAGKDPPPPPAISVGGYEGNEGNTGIQDIMSNIKDDVQHDLDKLKDNEKNTKDDYEQLKSDLENAVSNKMVFKGEKETEIADKLTEISDANGEKMSEKTVLDFAVSNLQTLEPDCDYVLTNHAVRVSNRQLECDSVDEALELLEGDVKEVECKPE